MENLKENNLLDVFQKGTIENYQKKKYFLNINLKSYKNIYSNDILNVCPFFEIEGPNNNINEQFSFELNESLKDLEYLKISIRVWHKANILEFSFQNTELATYTIDVAYILNRSNNNLNDVWGLLENKDDDLNEGLLNFDVKLNEQNQKIVGRANEIFEDVLNDDFNNNKNGELFQKSIPIFTKYNLHIYLLKGNFAKIENKMNCENLKYRIYLNSENYQESLISVNNNVANINKEINFKIYLPCFLDRVVVEIYDNENYLDKFFLDIFKLQRDKILEPKWFNLYGPSKKESFLSSITKTFKKKDLYPEKHLYYGQILAKAKLIKDDKIVNNFDDMTNNLEIREKINITKYAFWFDLYQLRFIDDNYSGEKIEIEYQFSTFIGISQNATYNPERRKFYWKNEDRRIKRVNIEMTSDLNDLPICFIRIKINNEYIGYIKFEIKDIINKLEVKPCWMRIRKCETNLKKFDDLENYVGELYCAFNVFVDNKNEMTKRPALIDNTNYKNFILISRIYMGKNFPILHKNQSSLCEVQFYNNIENPVKTQEILETANPSWMKTLFFQARLNENLEFTQNIKLKAKISKNKSECTVGETEIPINKIDVFRDERQIEKEKVFKKAKWYSVDCQDSKDKCYILARFILLMIPKQEKQTLIKLKNLLEMDRPGKSRSYLQFFILGFRNLTKSLDKASLRIKYDNQDLVNRGENENPNNHHHLTEIDKENYKKGSFKDRGVYNYNVLYDLRDGKNKYILIDLPDEDNFLKNLTVEIYDNYHLVYDVNIEVKNNLKGSKPHAHLNKVSLKKKSVLNPLAKKKDQEYIKALSNRKSLIYGDIDEKNRLISMSSIIPNNYDESNIRIGRLFELKTNNIQENDLDEDEEESENNLRPEINGEYELELSSNNCLFKTEKLRIEENNNISEGSEILYLLKIIRSDEEALRDERRDFEKNCQIFKNYSKIGITLICRIYLLNISNILFDNIKGKKGIFRIKNFGDHNKYKSEKEFDILPGEINEIVTLHLKWPSNMNITIEIFTKDPNKAKESLLGFTTLNLEKRFFNQNYSEKLENIQKFKQIPIESRTLIYKEGDQVTSKGALRMWVELFDKSEENNFPLQYLPSNNIEEYEIRFVIWRLRNIHKSQSEKLNLSVKLEITQDDNNREIKDFTDIHYNYFDGFAVFNYRFVEKILYPNKTNLLKLTVLNNSSIITGSLEVYAELIIDLTSHLRKIKKFKKYYPVKRKWEDLIDLRNKNTTGYPPQIEYEFKIITINDARINPVGKGQDERNDDPFLPKPTVGRGLIQKFTILNTIYEGFTGIYSSIFLTIKIVSYVISAVIILFIIYYFISIFKKK